MSDPMPLSLEQVSRILADPLRWKLLRELAKGEALPVNELARRTGSHENTASKHLAVIRGAGLVVTHYRLYQLAPAYRPAPGASHLDLGHGLVKLDGAV